MRSPAPRFGSLSPFLLALLVLACAPVMLLASRPWPSDALVAKFTPAAIATNTIGADLFQQIAGDDVTSNFVFSPFSVESAMALAYSGASGETKTEMARVLHFNSADADLASSFDALTRDLQEIAGDSEAGIDWRSTNRLFGQQGYGFRQSFLAQLRDGYHAPFEPIDFRMDTERARGRINDWVEDQTNSKIRGLIPAGGLNKDTRLVLVNTVYLKGPWQDEFQKTDARFFYIHGYSREKVPTMFGKQQIGYEQRDGYAAVALPYRGGDLRLIILFPDQPDGLAALKCRLTDRMLSECSHLPWIKTVLFLPKFSISGRTINLNRTFQSLGMATAFDRPEGSANFDAIAPRRIDDYLRLSDVFHQALIEVDERGATAAAATAIGLESITCAMREGPRYPDEIHVDRPFIFAIQHRASGACLFLGQVTDPR